MMGMGNVGHVARRQIKAVYQSGFTINPNVQFGAKVILIAFLALVHCLIPFAIGIPGRTRRRNQTGIHNGAMLEKQPSCGQIGVDSFEHRAGQMLGFQQMLP